MERRTTHAYDRNAAAAPGPERPLFGGRQIGRFGTASRLLGGAVAIATPIALNGFSGWDAAAALLLLPLIATVAAVAITAGFRLFAPDALQTRHWICSGPGCLLIVLILGANSALAALTPISGDVALWVWLGGSMLIAAAGGYGGCEVLAIPNLITGRNDQIGCLLYTPIDRWEAARNRLTTEPAVRTQTS